MDIQRSPISDGGVWNSPTSMTTNRSAFLHARMFGTIPFGHAGSIDRREKEILKWFVENSCCVNRRSPRRDHYRR